MDLRTVLLQIETKITDGKGKKRKAASQVEKDQIKKKIIPEDQANPLFEDMEATQQTSWRAWQAGRR